MTNAVDVLRLMESLALVIQDSAEIGNLDPEIYADMAELMGNMAAIAKALIGGDVA